MPEEILSEEIARYGNAILKYCFGILCDYHEAQDAMQETFVKAHFARGKLKSRENYGAWLRKIAYNTCMSMLRKRKRTLPLEECDASYLMPEPFIDPALTRALQILSPQDRALFYSRAVEDVDYLELEKLYGIRAAALRKRYARARQKLQEYLSDWK